MRASEMIRANSEVPGQPGQVMTHPGGDVDDCGPTSPQGGEHRARSGASSTANARLGLLIVVVTGAVVYGAIAVCIGRFL